MMKFTELLMLMLAGAVMVEGGAGASSHTFVVKSDCNATYLAIHANYTLCLVDNGADASLSAADKQAIVDKHNDYRSNVSPTATNMVKLVWDDAIAEYAVKWARQCTLGHDDYAARSLASMPGVSIGQNAAGGFDSVIKAIDGWHKEVEDFEHGVGNTTVGKTVGHYTQVVGFRAIRIGCGEATCTNAKYSRYQVCNYAVGQQTPDVKTPYEKGTSCSKCPSGKCSNNLCDCGDKLCLNGGSLDSSTCSCTCTGIWTGDTCTEKKCGTSQSWCKFVTKKSWCTIYSNIPVDCPKFCGIC
ncbi:cysteine-rich venom protein Mr30-like [Haliotis rubra]|uniref:cysteine-rich venom protein Mr30-like n=1 Tax=Haliotis rubra TaxID=36100 RepID=UPI001EE5BDE1|nr:cysteine-rich venom protein Mr30-like [Haliotis rubra]